MKSIIFFSILLLSTNIFSKTKSSTTQDFFKDIKIDRIGGHLGFVKPSDIDGTIAFGADLPLGTITKYPIHLKTSLEYWSKSYNSLVELTVSDFIISNYGTYHFKPFSNYKITPYAGAGVSIHFYSADVALGSLGKSSASSTNIGIDLLGGGLYPLNKKVELFSETKYRIVSDAGQFSITFGGLYKFE